MQKKKLRKLHLPKETLLYLGGEEIGQAAAGVTALSCYCTKVCNTNTAKVGQCCA